MIMDRVSRGMRSREKLPGRAADEQRIDGGERYSTELIYFKGYEFPMTRSEHADIQGELGQSSAARGAVRSDIKSAVSGVERPGKFSRSDATEEVYADWIEVGVGSVLGGENKNFTMMIPRSSAESILNNPEIGTIARWIDDDTGYLAINELPQDVQYDVYDSLYGMKGKYDSEVQTAITVAENQWNSAADAANANLDTQISSAYSAVDEAEQAETEYVGSANQRAIDEREVAKETALSF